MSDPAGLAEGIPELAIFGDAAPAQLRPTTPIRESRGLEILAAR